MPYKSEAQRKFMYARHPEIAKKWDREGKNYVKKGGSYSSNAVKLAQALRK